VLHPLFGQLADRWGGRRLTFVGLVFVACVLPALSRAWSYPSAIGLYTLQVATMACVITPSLAYMAEAVSQAGIGSFGVAYGLYNMAWGAGLMGGPPLGGFLFERLGFAPLLRVWAPLLVVVTGVLTRVQSPPLSRRQTT
jgi:MFS family permease